ncbi:unnamed protein product, partial [Ectocarpus sp. 4 AP-2014]
LSTSSLLYSSWILCVSLFGKQSSKQTGGFFRCVFLSLYVRSEHGRILATSNFVNFIIFLVILSRGRACVCIALWGTTEGQKKNARKNTALPEKNVRTTNSFHRKHRLAMKLSRNNTHHQQSNFSNQINMPPHTQRCSS